jgi:hypothetical protein
MARGKEKDDRGDMLQGTLAMLILRTILLATASRTRLNALQKTSFRWSMALSTRRCIDWKIAA